ncbi:group III truncated hemoglobin [Telluribacter sp.]|jgi:hemoglobin|uniref:group III truncated hemoglobin n=1 Tax=Telluribacter sp. TaxID=1978767 RepID=UPI002E10BAB6|nr:group III truncated hemoglobin [Telluribacter sp.]
MLSDITTRADVERLVDTFYNKVRADELIGPLFSEVARVNWDLHLPKMYDFWEGILFGTGQYRGRPMPPHFRLTQQHPLQAHHFERWLALFYQTADELFEGDKASEVKVRAQNIASIMEFRVGQINEINGAAS